MTHSAHNRGTTTRTSLHALVCALLVSCAANAQTSGTSDPQRAFELRCARAIATYDTARDPGIYGAAIRYARNTDLATADRLFLNSPQIRNPRGDMFWMFPTIGAIKHGAGRMGPEARAAARAVWKTYYPYRGDTENHWCLYYSSLLLAAEEWPGLPGSEWYNGRSSDELFRESKEYLLHWINTTTTIGQGEFDSPTYFPEYAIPMLLLAQFARDEEIRVKARLMADYLFADFAVDHLDGMYLGGLSREGASVVMNPGSAPASEFAWLYFGKGTIVPSGWILLPALSDYRLPRILYDVATDRSVPYVNRERKRVRNVIRHGSVLNPPVYKYSFVSAAYGLSSIQGGILQPIQQHTWSLRFSHRRAGHTVFGLHPWWSGRELAMFFPEKEALLVDDVTRSKGTYNKEDKWTGSSPYERIMQHRNTLIALYDIDSAANSGHIDLFFPRTLETRFVDSSGWVFCRADSLYIAVYPLREGEWLDLPADEGNHRFRSAQRQNGYVVEARSRFEAGSFQQFVARLRAMRPRAVLRPGAVSVTYTTPEGARLDFRFPDTRRLNGAAVDLARTPLFDSPFTQAAVGSGKLLIRHGTRSRLLDFRAGRVVEK